MNLPIVVRPVSLGTFSKCLDGEIFQTGEDTDIDSSAAEQTGAEESESESEESSSEEESESESDSPPTPRVRARPERKETRETKKILNEDFGYLVSMQIRTLTQEKADELQSQRDKKQAEMDFLKRTTPKEMWKKDLDELSDALVQHNHDWMERRTDDSDTSNRSNKRAKTRKRVSKRR
jgi:hypothetical protein